MKRIFLTLAIVLALCTFAIAQAATDKKTTASELDSAVKGMETELVPAVEAMPEGKFAFAPTAGEFKGVRTFALQAKHVAAVNYMVAASILGEKPPVELGGENGPDSVKSKAEIVKFLKDSFTYVHKAIGTITESNSLAPIESPFGEGKTTRLSMGVLLAGHGFDHYGQVVEYLRMNGIIPPASRQ